MAKPIIANGPHALRQDVTEVTPHKLLSGDGFGFEAVVVTRRDNRGESGVYTFEIISGFGERGTRGMLRGIRAGGGRSGSLRAPRPRGEKAGAESPSGTDGAGLVGLFGEREVRIGL